MSVVVERDGDGSVSFRRPSAIDVERRADGSMLFRRQRGRLPTGEFGDEIAGLGTTMLSDTARPGSVRAGGGEE